MKRLSLLCLAACLALVLAAPAGATGLAQTMADNFLAGKAIPLPSSVVKGLNVKKAYQVQNQFVALLVKKGQVISGYKAGLTSKPARKRFKANSAVTASLFQGGAMAPGAVDHKKFTRLFLEVEIGYFLKQDVTKPTSAKKVKALIENVAPVIELPDINFAQMKGLGLADIIAGNVGSKAYMVGKIIPIKGFKVGKVSAQLFHNGKALSKKPIPSRAAMGGQYKALAWSINNVLAQGGKLKKGMLIITGSLGPMYPGKPGAYKAAYTGGLSNIEFTVK